MKKVISILCLLIAITELQAQNHLRRANGESAIFECDITGSASTYDSPPKPYGESLHTGMQIDSIGQKEIGDTVYIIIRIIDYKIGFEEEMMAYNYKLSAEDVAIFRANEESAMAEINQRITLASNATEDQKADYEKKKKDALKTALAGQTIEKAKLRKKIKDGGMTYQRYFLIAKSDFDAKTDKKTGCNCSELTGGSLAIPIKLRFENNKIYDFSKDITVGAVGGWRFKCLHCDKLSLVPFVGLGITSIGLDSTNTFGAVKTASDRSGITAITGLMFETHKGLQFSLIGGWDYIAKKENIDWIQNGNFWFGFGIGYALFTEASPPGESSKGKSKGQKTES